MSIQAVAWALEQKLPATAKLVLVAVCNHANNVDGYCWLNTETIAQEAACVPRSVYRFVGALVRNGYIRKEKRRADDGRQRANDYWVLFNRPDAEWDWNAGAHEEGHNLADDEIVHDDAEDAISDTTSCEPGDSMSPGQSAEKSPGQSPNMPPESPRPGDNGVTRERVAEPSKSNPKEILHSGLTPSVPRSYRPPPPEPQAAVVNAGKQVFVYEGTRAWEAWAAFKLKETGVHWTLSRTTYIDGKPHSGWWFPSLFPPKYEPPIEHPQSLATEAELEEFANSS